MTSAPRTVRDIPALDQALFCALPILFRHVEHPDLPGTLWGTATAVSFKGRTLFLTTRHQTNSVDEGSQLLVVTGFGGV